MRATRFRVPAVAGVMVLLAACTSSAGGPPGAPDPRGSSLPTAAGTIVDTWPSPSTASSGSAAPSSSGPMSTPPSTSSAPPVPSAPPSQPRPSTGPASGSAAGPQLPLGGRTILPTYRVVAYYGAPFNSGLGVLGQGTPDQAAAAIARTAAGYRGYGRPVQPAMELIATVAQGSPGADGDYSAAVSTTDIATYLAAAHRHHMLLVLDFQPGRGDFLPQVKQFEQFLRDPSVGVALDPEWKVSAPNKPAQVIGSASAASINAVSDYLVGLIRAHHLPQKLFVVHQFTLSMLPDRAGIKTHPELATVLHADGHGTIPVKRAVYSQLAFPPQFGAGFKLFYREDAALMTPAQVMALNRRPDLVTYQ
jgi:hypothetical protein